MSTSRWALVSPKYWPTWIALVVMRCCERLPYKVQMAFGAAVGTFVGWLPMRWVSNARRNIELCLPELNVGEREKILRGHFRCLGRGLFETAISWWSSDKRIRQLTQLEGMEHLTAALAKGKGAILLSAHFTTLEIGARAICSRERINIMYRPSRNQLLERFLARNRGAHTLRAIERNDIRTLVTALGANEVVWYAADQSYRKKGAAMVPFFGIPAATNTATSRLARMTGAAILPYFPEYLPGGGYRMTIHPPLENFPSGDAVADALRFNAYIEAHVRHVPEQYLWIHRRFKGLSEDYPNYYAAR